jgi:hypothetical protein
VESLFAASLHISDFVQTQNKAKILTKMKEPRKKEYYRIFFKKMKELSGENNAEY